MRRSGGGWDSALMETTTADKATMEHRLGGDNGNIGGSNGWRWRRVVRGLWRKGGGGVKVEMIAAIMEEVDVVMTMTLYGGDKGSTPDGRQWRWAR
ncbi:hypothetical protein Scep_015520 [Stephania cephalantha]|uniref:Uncharacterized protein n=1 Tax=Stephania cephalantha TaxID=152367 RepID=A0AAP0J3B3_9MAGN